MLKCNVVLQTSLIVLFRLELPYSGLNLLNEKVGFKIPTTRYRKNSILCGALHIGTAKWTSDVGWSFGASRVARGIKGSGTGLTFDPYGYFQT